MKNPFDRYDAMLLVVFMLISTCPGCSDITGSKAKADKYIVIAAAKIAEESKALTTATVDALDTAAPSPSVDLAKTFARKDQELEGLPLPSMRYDVSGILASNKVAIAEMRARFDRTEKLIEENEELKKKSAEKDQKLIEMGKLYEIEKNKNIVKKVWHWFIGLLGVGTFGGIIALCVIFPPAAAIILPVVSRFLGWVVSMVPKLSGYLSVVSVKVVDRMAKGVEDFKDQIRTKNATPSIDLLKGELKGSMDEADKNIVDVRKAKLKRINLARL